MGEIWPSAQPAANPDLYGKVEFSPNGAFEVRSFQTFHLVYTAGLYGMDDTGAIQHRAFQTGTVESGCPYPASSG